MPKKANTESQKEQSKRFLEKVQELADDGDLDLTEAEEKFEKAVSALSKKSAISGRKSDH